MTRAGSGWIAAQHGDRALSPLGRDVADLLGEVFDGIYHLAGAAHGPDWWSRTSVEVAVGAPLATFDGSALTRLVIAAHDRAIRMEVAAVRTGVCGAQDCWQPERSHEAIAPGQLRDLDGWHAYDEADHVAELVLRFSPRSREGAGHERHPTIEQAVEAARAGRDRGAAIVSTMPADDPHVLAIRAEAASAGCPCFGRCHDDGPTAFGVGGFPCSPLCDMAGRRDRTHVDLTAGGRGRYDTERGGGQPGQGGGGDGR